MNRFLCVIWILLVLLLLFSNTLIVATSGSQPPKINVLEVGKKWENITGKSGALPNGVNSIYSDTGDDLEISCIANYPIRWNITGIITPREIVKIQPTKRDLIKGTFLIEIKIFFLDAENYTGLAASSNIACEEVGNYNNRDELVVFVKGYNKGSGLVTPRMTYLEGTNITLIPCPTTNPLTKSKTELYLKTQVKSGDVLVENVIYNPTEGFRRSSPGDLGFIGGTYICKNGGQSVTITVAGLPTGDNKFFPISDTVRVFSDESMEFHCGSKTKPVNLIFEHSNQTVQNALVDEEKTKVVRFARGPISGLGEHPILEGKAACIGEGDVLIKEWHWVFVDPPKLHLDNLEGEADCLTELRPKIVQTVRCKDGMDCQFMKGCLENKTDCNFKKQKQFYGNVDTYCWVDELQKGMPCASVPFSHLNGLVKCGVLGNGMPGTIELERQWEFFISLDYKRYSNWLDTPHKEIIRIEEISIDDPDSDAFTDDSTHFVCTASAFLFADSLAFEVHYKNGTTVLIQEESLSSSSTLPQKLHSNMKTKKPHHILELNVRALLDKRKLSKDVTDVNCLAPFWNDTKVLKSRVSFNPAGMRFSNKLAKNIVKDPSTLESTEVVEQNEEFYIGQMNKRLNCSGGRGFGFGQDIEWIYRKSAKEVEFKNVTEVYPELKPEDDYLEFPMVEKKHAGEYQCVQASGITADITVLSKFKLDVSAEPLPTSTTVYVGLTILVLVIVGLGIAAFAVFVQKRNN